MSHFVGVTIRGIRSFGPNDEDKGMIKFRRPLTLIMGQNGCGKTTIIEALKYACTGEMPPGSQRGQSFVHDPNMAGEATVKGTVKLAFCNLRDQMMVCQRIIEASQKVKQISVKTLDVTLSRVEEDRQVHINKKCADMDLEMFAALGATKPILNHVIFCHQEDSNWPLDEGKKLKERFDAIFDATEYLNCIKKMKDQAKMLRSDEAVKKAEAVAAQKDYAEAQRLRQEIREEQERLSNSERLVEKSEQDLQTVSDQLSDVQKQQRQMADIEAEHSSALSLLAEAERACNELQSSVERPGGWRPSCDGDMTDEQLQKMLDEMSGEAERLNGNMQRDKSQLSDVERQLLTLSETEGKLNVELGKLEAAEERSQQNRLERDQLVRRLATTYDCSQSQSTTLSSVEEHHAELSEKYVRSVAARVRESVSDAEEGLQQAQAATVADVQQAQDRLDAARCRHTKLEADVLHCRQKIAANDAEVAEKQRLLSEARGSASKMQQLDQQLAAVETRHAALSAQVDVDVLSERCAADERSLAQLESGIQRLQADKDKLMECAALRSQLDINQQTVDKKNGEITQILAENAANFEVVGMAGDQLTPGRLSDALKSRLSQLSVAQNKKEAECRRLQKQVNGAEVDERQARELVTSLERELAADEAELLAVLQTSDLDEELTAAATSAQDLEKSHGQLTAMQRLYTGYIDKLSRRGAEGDRSATGETACPLCRRNFDHAHQSVQLIDELRRMIDGLPAEIASADVQKQRARARHDDLLTLRPKQEHATRLRDSQLPTARSRLRTAVDELTRISDAQRRTQHELTDVERRRRIAEQLSAAASRVDERHSDVAVLRDKCEQLRAQLPQLTDSSNSSTINSVQQVDELLASQRRSQTATRSRLRDTENQLREHRQLLSDVIDERQQLQARRLQLQRLHVDQHQLSTRCEQLQSEITQLRQQLQQLSDQLTSLDKEVSEENAARERTAATARKRELDCRRRLETLQADWRQLEAAQQLMAQQLRASGDRQLLNVRQQLRGLVEQMSGERQRASRLRDSIESARQQLSSQETRQRDVRDYQQLRVRRGEAASLQATCRTAQQRLGEYDGRRLAAERNSLAVKHQRLTQLVYGERGGQQRMRDVLAARANKLATPQFSQADAVFRRCQLECCCYRLAEKDLSVYAKLLDDALISFHAERMAQINELVRELWRSCYGGNDIDHIAIRTDSGAAGVAAGTGGATRRTSYNYRVVMIRNDQELDMRGRCSAGQKVLACLIIRMALAETFGTSCGMLTLDEPTTNLDRENVVRLAESLAEIVTKRSAQANFQLVIITHDTVFLDILSRYDLVRKYYDVTRKPNGLSHVRERNHDDRDGLF